MFNRDEPVPAEGAVARVPSLLHYQCSVFSLHRSVSTVVTEYYFLSLMGHFSAQRDREQQSDNRGESSGTASGTHHQHGGEGSSDRSNVNTGLKTRRSGNGPANMHISAQQDGSNQSGVRMELESSRAMVEDYVRYCLEKNGIAWVNGQRDARPDEVQTAMRLLGDELEARFSDSLNHMIRRLDLTPENGQERVTEVMEEIFSDGVSWGRIAAMVEFAAKLSVRCAQKDEHHLVLPIVDWVSNYVDTRLKSWIVEHNGWTGFVNFSEDPEKHSKESWSSLKKLFTVGAAATVGLLTLGALLKS
ncbi:bcl-2-like protein 2 isoform X2 [Babylonia areolata]|uniref:bcl-2-like protein 2 isoform X2 n=1 Tax=Babylonia areolata TaxID=304850 RepID=UPI003FD44A30